MYLYYSDQESTMAFQFLPNKTLSFVWYFRVLAGWSEPTFPNWGSIPLPLETPLPVKTVAVTLSIILFHLLTWIPSKMSSFPSMFKILPSVKSSTHPVLGGEFPPPLLAWNGLSYRGTIKVHCHITSDLHEALLDNFIFEDRDDFDCYFILRIYSSVFCTKCVVNKQNLLSIRCFFISYLEI